MIFVYSSNQKIKSSLYSRYYAEACNEWRGLSPRIGAWATIPKKRRKGEASRWRHCVRCDWPWKQNQTSRADIDVFTTELARVRFCYFQSNPHLITSLHTGTILCFRLLLRRTVQSLGCALCNSRNVNESTNLTLLDLFMTL